MLKMVYNNADNKFVNFYKAYTNGTDSYIYEDAKCTEMVSAEDLEYAITNSRVGIFDEDGEVMFVVTITPHTDNVEYATAICYSGSSETFETFYTKEYDVEEDNEDEEEDGDQGDNNGDQGDNVG